MHHASAELIARAMLDKSTSHDLKYKAKQANNAVLDAIGIAMHHDAITGTADEPVVTDYFRIVGEAEESLKDVYNDLISMKAYKMAGLYSDHW